MSCNETKTLLDDYVDGMLQATEVARLDRHVAACSDCRRLVTDERELRDSLKHYGSVTAPLPDQEFFDRALLRAAHSGSRKQRNRWMLTGFGGAIAAGIAVWMVAGFLIKTPTLPEPGVPVVTMALEEPRTVNLVFSSAEELDDATLTVNLPAGLELAGFEGQREITWMTSLKEGKNVLPLKLIATMPHNGELLATLRHEDDDRTFRIQVTAI